MPSYDYKCHKCEIVIEIFHAMSDESKHLCEECGEKMEKQISGGGYVIFNGLNGSIADHKQSEHTKKVKDPERAVKMRKKTFGSDAVGDTGMTSDPRHVVRRGRTLGGAQKEVDRAEFIKAAAKDPAIVDQCIKSLKSSKDKK